MLASPWGVREEVSPDSADGLKEYISALEGSKLMLDSGETVEVLKADVKERKGEAVLLFRYQLVKD